MVWTLVLTEPVTCQRSLDPWARVRAGAVWPRSRQAGLLPERLGDFWEMRRSSPSQR